MTPAEIDALIARLSEHCVKTVANANYPADAWKDIRKAIAAIAALARENALVHERCAVQCREIATRSQGFPDDTDFDRGYSAGAKNCESAIRALAQKEKR